MQSKTLDFILHGMEKNVWNVLVPTMLQPRYLREAEVMHLLLIYRTMKHNINP